MPLTDHFPQLRRRCESRGVTGVRGPAVGVPDEAKAEGKVLPLCLAEIERCRPYFIGLLGERYGWVPEEIPEELVEAQPWLAGYRKQSVTALRLPAVWTLPRTGPSRRSCRVAMGR
jgi:hypothetical protein